MLNLEQQLVNLSRLIKNGRISFTVLTMDKAGDAISNELLIDYDEYPERPILKVKKPDGTIVPIGSEMDFYLEGVLENILEVSVSRSSTYQPSIWFAIKTDPTTNDTTFNSQSVIDQFYDTIMNNLTVLKPHIQHVYKDGEEEMLVPFVDSEHVFFNMQTLVGGNKNIKTLEDVIQYLKTHISDVKTQMIAYIQQLTDLLNSIKNELSAINNEQDDKIDDILQNQSSLENLLSQAITGLNNISANTEKDVRKTVINIGNDPTKMYPVQIYYNPSTVGDVIPSGGRHAFNGDLYLVASNSIYDVVTKMGDGVMANYYHTDIKGNFVYRATLKGTANRSELPILNFVMYSGFSFVVYVKGGTTLEVWTKYKESLQYIVNTTTVTLNGVSYPVRPMTDIVNLMIQGDNRYTLGVNEFNTTSSLNVVRDIILQNKYALEVVVL